MFAYEGPRGQVVVPSPPTYVPGKQCCCCKEKPMIPAVANPSSVVQSAASTYRGGVIPQTEAERQASIASGEVIDGSKGHTPPGFNSLSNISRNDIYAMLAQFFLQNFGASVRNTPSAPTFAPATHTPGFPDRGAADYPNLPDNPLDMPPTRPVLAWGTPDNEVIEGDAENDILRGAEGSDTITGLAGDDEICGGAGDDHLDGGFNDDVICGGTGDDTITGNLGNDTIDGGAGDDTTMFGGDLRSYKITRTGEDQFSVQHIDAGRGRANEGTDTVRGVETLVFADQTVDLKSFDLQSNARRA
jgi:Ca2+-binding RTX toxin-like protein